MSCCLQMFFVSCRHETRIRHQESADPQPAEVCLNSESSPIGISSDLFRTARLPADVNRGHRSELEQHLQFPVRGETLCTDDNRWERGSKRSGSALVSL